jgi:GrpB-like predicted nucleotidyltransferase (UPF0157 family)
MRYAFEPEPPEAELIGNVRCACFSGDKVLVIETVEFGLSAFPGGMLEPREDWTHALERELLEEAGARPLSIEVVGRIRFWSGLDAPFRPHLPHPEFHQVVTYAEVEVVGNPSNPPDGEQVLSVEQLLVEGAVERLRAGNPLEAELLRFVADVREEQSAPLPVVVVPYDPAWHTMFERERVAILAALADLDVAIEHMGSTAVPGLAAKPKIDILIGLRSWDDLDTAIDALLGIGYEHERQLLKPEHLSLRRGRPHHTTHRVHLVVRNGEDWRDVLAFRDALRDDADLAARYGQLKQDLARRHADDLSHEAYMSGKAPFIDAVLAACPGDSRPSGKAEP